MTSLMPLLKGFSITLGLIIPIGAQNAFVLKRGIMRRHVLGTILTCMTIDAILITSGVMGFGALVMEMPVLMTICKWGGAVFLIFYGARSLRSAFQSNR
ncbi:MAG: LysE/ArgO family amino acid transporter [Alphaproteobacteria bacterium]